ncbi:MAG: class I SAM-dependent methyltransferase [Clostridiales bacterium]|nr:class I SAM-dependent methyltransferase [Clostridiales bacterium]
MIDTGATLDNWFSEKLYMDKLSLRDGVYRLDSSDQIAVSYDDMSHDRFYEVEDKSFWFKHRNRVILEGVLHTPPEHNRVVEVGGGNGNTAYYLAQHGFEAAMFEPGERGCRNAIKRGMKNVVCSLLSPECVREESLEAIGLFDVVEHIEDDVGFLKEIKGLLIDNGLLYITVPAHKMLWSSSDKSHFRRYDKKAICNVLEESGYDVLYATYFFWFLPVLIFMLRALPYRLKRKGKAKAGKKSKGGGGGFFIVPAFVEKVFNAILRGETKRIHKGRGMPVGASLFLVAAKLSDD